MGKSMGAIIEDIDDKLDLILEAHAALAPLPERVNEIEERLAKVESDTCVIRRVVTEYSQELKIINQKLDHHHSRLGKLENSI